MDRRAFLSGTAGLFGAAVAFPVFAQQSPMIGGQAEWAQTYDTGTIRSRNIRTSYPILGPATAQALEGAIGVYQQLVARGGHPPLPSDQRLKLGTRHPNVQALRARLIELGDLSPNVGNSDIFDSFVDGAVKRYQARHGLTPTGVVGVQTFAALNTPAEIRLRQLEINLVRLRGYPGNLG
ncbi:MAG: peptidoglycan-binding protein, partial [Rhabdaerophilum sp.]